MLLHRTSWGLFCASIILLAACNSSTEVALEKPEVDSAVSEPLIEESSKPNILLILADDLGYTDLGVYGSEINTPNIDQLARDGLLFTDFHNQAVCGPTRAAILSGTDSRNAGGAMHQSPNQLGVPGYESYLNQDIVAFPALLQVGGYQTYFAGKWHLGKEEHQTPDARGFDRSFALMEGGASHYSDMRGMFHYLREAGYYEDGERLTELPSGFYSSDFYTDYIIDSIEQGRSEGDPWFSYLAFTAPHWPLQAPDEYIEKYDGVYDVGYEVLREQRIARGKELGVIPSEAKTYPRLEIVEAWDSLTEEEQRDSSKKMAIYAGMIDSLDENVGRLMDYLEDSGQLDNTLIVFLSDNGAEGAIRNPGDNGTDWTFDNSYENIGAVGSHVYLNAGWTQASIGVMKQYKGFSSEGGTRGPAIIYHPEITKGGQITDAFASVVDLAPTFLEYAGIDHPERGYNGQPLQALQGKSMLPLIFEEAESVHPDDFAFGWEVFGHRALRKGDWKILWLTSQPSERAQSLAEGADKWGLFDMVNDPGETTDLSEEYPDVMADMLNEWDSYMAKNGIVLPIWE